MFDTKIALLLHPDLASWQKLNVTAFLASGIAGAVPEAMGAPYEDAAGRRHARLLGQPVLIFAAPSETLQKSWAKAVDTGLVRAAFVRSMFTTGHDHANREAFLAEDPAAPDLVGLALYGPKKDVDRIIKGAKLHP